MVRYITVRGGSVCPLPHSTFDHVESLHMLVYVKVHADAMHRCTHLCTPVCVEGQLGAGPSSLHCRKYYFTTHLRHLGDQPTSEYP